MIDEAPERNVDFVLDNGFDRRYSIVEMLPGGSALLDADLDGDLDLYLVQAGSIDSESRSPNRLFLNDGTGRFELLEDSGAEDTGWSIAVATGDADGDGIVDLFVANLGRDELYRGLGDGRFERITELAGIHGDGLSSGASFADLDGDGDQDLVVLRYLDWGWHREKECFGQHGERDYCGPGQYPFPVPDRLFENLGGGRFRDITESSGFLAAEGKALGIGIGDFDGDGRFDIAIANDGTPDHLWRNRGGLVFVEEAMFWGSAIGLDGNARAGMGVDLADLDDDDDLDQIVVHLAGETDFLLLNEGGRFRDEGASSGLGVSTRSFTRFGVVIADFDHDGSLDLLFANGRVERSRDQYSAQDPYAEPNLLLRGSDGLRFEVVDGAFGPSERSIRSSRGIALGDLDGDLDLDAVITNHNAPVSLLINHSPKGGDAILIDVRERSGAPAIGATIRMGIGDRMVRRDVWTTRGYASASDHRIHIGLGEADAPHSAEVTWTDGSCERFKLAELLRRGQGGPCQPVD